MAQVARRHFKLQNTIHWVKSIAIDREAAGAGAGLERDVAVGHYKPINSDRFVNDCHEFIFHFSPGGRTRLDRRAVGVPYQDPSNIKRWAKAGDGLRCRGNTWFIPYETIQSRDRDRPHPASFPPKVPEQCIRLHGLDRAGVVLDPFLGLGSTAIAAARLGLDFIGIEMDEHYLSEAVARVKTRTRRKTLGHAKVTKIFQRRRATPRSEPTRELREGVPSLLRELLSPWLSSSPCTAFYQRNLARSACRAARRACCWLRSAPGTRRPRRCTVTLFVAASKLELAARYFVVRERRVVGPVEDVEGLPQRDELPAAAEVERLRQPHVDRLAAGLAEAVALVERRAVRRAAAVDVAVLGGAGAGHRAAADGSAG